MTDKSQHYPYSIQQSWRNAGAVLWQNVTKRNWPLNVVESCISKSHNTSIETLALVSECVCVCTTRLCARYGHKTSLTLMDTSDDLYDDAWRLFGLDFTGLALILVQDSMQVIPDSNIMLGTVCGEVEC